MIDIFVSYPGYLTAVSTQSLPPLTVLLDDWDGFQEMNALITGLALQTQAGVQFLHTLDQFIYIYTFGERIRDMTISGIAFTGTCGDYAGATLEHGLERVLSYYDGNSVIERDEAVVISMGVDTALNGFLIGSQLLAQDPDKGICQFSLNFKVLPP